MIPHRGLRLLHVSTFVAFVILACLPARAASDGRACSLDEGLHAFHQGAFETAVARWTEALQAYDQEGDVRGRLTVLLNLSDAHLALGQHRQAKGRLEAALELAERLDDQGQIAAALASLGNVHIAIGPPETAETHLRRSLTIARDRRDAVLAATVLNNLGNLQASQSKLAEAAAAYTEAVAIAEGQGRRALAARALANAAIVARRAGRVGAARALLDRASAHLEQAGPAHEIAVVLVNLGVAYRDLRPVLPRDADALLLQAWSVLNRAAGMAESLGDRRTASYAWGFFGALYEDERRFPEALRVTRKAIFAAQQVHAPESLYRWEWQAARLLRKTGAIDEALAAYRRAVQALESIRPELAIRYAAPEASFRESVGAVYFELVDLLLRQSERAPDRNQVEALLTEARDTVESLKVAELRDYFRDDCVDLALSKVTRLDVVSPKSAVVYPIVLPDRTEILVTLPGGFRRFVVPVGREALTDEVLRFRRMLEKRTTRQYLPHAQRLYAWLIRPFESSLPPEIDTLVFVPDGPLRTIPMSALHDGTQFLIAKYALAITPGLRLTDPRPISRERARVLGVGVAAAVQGFPPLPEVLVELQALRDIFPGQTLLNEEFSVRNMERRLKEEEFTILHVASHGQFGGQVDRTFLLAFDDKLTIDRLDQLVGLFQFRETPLELLTLSACDTAVGDERAALGLAGVAVKAGARSALATLWNINDVASSDLVTEFYRQLQDPTVSRAGALQRAQMKILTDPRYEHPGFWSPFLMINNWL